MGLGLRVYYLGFRVYDLGMIRFRVYGSASAVPKAGGSEKPGSNPRFRHFLITHHPW